MNTLSTTALINRLTRAWHLSVIRFLEEHFSSDLSFEDMRGAGEYEAEEYV